MREEITDQKIHTIIAQYVFIQHAALALPRDISHPDTANAESDLFGSRMNFLPERFIQFLISIR